MKQKKANEILHITFYNPNTPEETIKELIRIAAEVAKASVSSALLGVEQVPNIEPSEEPAEEETPAFEMQMV
ncbi:MAG: hypothetical protein RR423_02970 [Hydrogenoanaerobacterium sp.]